MRIKTLLTTAALLSALALSVPAQASGYFSFGFSTGPGYYAQPHGYWGPGPYRHPPRPWPYYYGYYAAPPVYYAPRPYYYKPYRWRHKHGYRGRYRGPRH